MTVGFVPRSVATPGRTAAVLMAAVRAYRYVLSPWIGKHCRFEPTCSAYALQALALHGAASGSWIAVRRVARCNPFCSGGCDPVPLPTSSLGQPPQRHWPSTRPSCTDRAAAPPIVRTK